MCEGHNDNKYDEMELNHAVTMFGVMLCGFGLVIWDTGPCMIGLVMVGLSTWWRKWKTGKWW